ncbi:MAG: hypothetical protein AB1420_07030 [Bacillota bacterium]
MNRLAVRFLNPPSSPKKKFPPIAFSPGDVFVASVINQKCVCQAAQQILVAIAAQVLFIIEAQFGFATNQDDDEIKT